MGQGVRVKEVLFRNVRRGWFGMKVMLAMALFGSALIWSSTTAAGQGGGLTGEPKRSYGAIDVIMYQTSW
jgi:hypothetical protein